MVSPASEPPILSMPNTVERARMRREATERVARANAGEATDLRIELEEARLVSTWQAGRIDALVVQLAEANARHRAAAEVAHAGVAANADVGWLRGHLGMAQGEDPPVFLDRIRAEATKAEHDRWGAALGFTLPDAAAQRLRALTPPGRYRIVDASSVGDQPSTWWGTNQAGAEKQAAMLEVHPWLFQPDPTPPRNREGLAVVLVPPDAAAPTTQAGTPAAGEPGGPHHDNCPASRVPGAACSCRASSPADKPAADGKRRATPRAERVTTVELAKAVRAAADAARATGGKIADMATVFEPYIGRTIVKAKADAGDSATVTPIAGEVVTTTAIQAPAPGMTAGAPPAPIRWEPFEFGHRLMVERLGRGEPVELARLTSYPADAPAKEVTTILGPDTTYSPEARRDQRPSRLPIDRFDTRAHGFAEDLVVAGLCHVITSLTGGMVTIGDGGPPPAGGADATG